MIPRIPHPWSPGKYPHEALDGTGITPQTPHAEVLDASLRLMKAGQMTPELRAAWDEVRYPARRLATDFFLYDPALCDPERLVEDALRRLRQAMKG
jgi:hypothetical protein